MTLRQLGQRLLGLTPAACSGTSAFAAAGAALTHASAALGGLAAPQPQPVASSSGRGAPAGSRVSLSGKVAKHLQQPCHRFVWCQLLRASAKSEHYAVGPKALARGVCHALSVCL